MKLYCSIPTDNWTDVDTGMFEAYLQGLKTDAFLSKLKNQQSISVFLCQAPKIKERVLILLFPIAQESHWEELIKEEATSPQRVNSID